jgi:hypothetical protein
VEVIYFSLGECEVQLQAANKLTHGNGSYAKYVYFGHKKIENYSCDSCNMIRNKKYHTDNWFSDNNDLFVQLRCSEKVLLTELFKPWIRILSDIINNQM